MKLNWEKIQITLTVICGASLALAWAAMFTSALGNSHVYAFISVAAGSVFALRSTFRSLARKSLDVNLLMVLAAIGAIVVDHVEDAAVLLFLFSLSSLLESMAERKTEDAIEALVKLRPEEAILVTPQGDQSVRVETLLVGDQVRVLPFERIPTDGDLITERAEIDEATLTGESLPVSKLPGNSLFAGTQNLDSMLLMRVTQEAKNSTLEKIVELVKEARENKTSGEKISAWFGDRYTIIVIVLFLGSLGVRSLLGMSFGTAFYHSLILLVALSPCAIVISAPAASLSALAHAARRGVLVRGGQYLEEAGKITQVVMDKTGTLTEGKPKVIEVCIGVAPVAIPAADDDIRIQCWHAGEHPSHEARAVLRLAASAESFSTHPIAQSIVQFAKDLNIDIPEATEHRAVAGQGVEALIEGRTVRAGQVKLFEGESDALPQEFRDHVEEMRTRGLTAVLVHTGTEWSAIGMIDAPRPGAKDVIRRIREAGVSKLIMLTGDNNTTAQAVASEIGIEDFRASQTPESKYAYVQQQQNKGEHVMMVGDGVNDAPALSAASLGVAMGGLGSEIALRSADIVLVGDRVERIPELIQLGRRTNAIIKFNLFFAVGIIAMLTIGSFFGKVPLPLAVLGHEGSTAIVVLNGLRLLRSPKS